VARDELLKKGWRRHSVVSLSKESIDSLAAELPQKAIDKLSIEGAIVLIALYDCAVVHGSFDQEPWVQLLIAVPVVFQKQLSKGRDARRLHFYATKNGQEHSFEINACSICQVGREFLLQLNVDEFCNVDDAAKFDLKQWLAERYRQDTWPDAFNTAVSKRSKKLKKFYERYNDFVSGLYLKLDSYRELTEGKYTVAIIVAIEAGKERQLFLHMREILQDQKGKSMDELKSHFANEVLNAFGDVVIFQKDRTNTVHSVAIEVMEENQITLHHQRTFSRFSPYSLSEYGTDAPVPTEMISGRVH